MEDIIEPAKSGRASCRKCKEKIEKGVLRFGHSVDSGFSDEPTYQWYHLNCAATKFPSSMGKLLESTEQEIENPEELKELMATNKKKEKPSRYPYAEHAKTSRSTCQGCGEKIEKGTYRIAIEREIDAGGFTRKGPAFFHPACIADTDEFEDPDDFLDQLQANSVSLEESDLDEIADQLG